jgi:hypothetical protein
LCGDRVLAYHGHGVDWAGSGREVGSVLEVGPVQFFVPFPISPLFSVLFDTPGSSAFFLNSIPATADLDD